MICFKTVQRYFILVDFFSKFVDNQIDRRSLMSIENAKMRHKFPVRGFTDKICECPTDNKFNTRYIFY